MCTCVFVYVGHIHIHTCTHHTTSSTHANNPQQTPHPQVQWSLKSKGGVFQAPALSRDGKLLAMTTRSGEVMMLDTTPGKKEMERCVGAWVYVAWDF